jgi:hypothetical protein
LAGVFDEAEDGKDFARHLRPADRVDEVKGFGEHPDQRDAGAGRFLVGGPVDHLHAAEGIGTLAEGDGPDAGVGDDDAILHQRIPAGTGEVIAAVPVFPGHQGGMEKRGVRADAECAAEKLTQLPEILGRGRTKERFHA